MAYIEKTAFEPRIWNNRNDDTQTISAYFKGASDYEVCSAGFICKLAGGEAPDGGKCWIATAGAAADGDLYICNPGDVQRGVIGGNLYAEGVNTLGLAAPKGEIAPFSKAIPGEVYAFGPGNFSTLVSTTNKYAAVANGLLGGMATKPTTGIYFELDPVLGIDNFTESNYNAFARYNLICRKA